MPEDERRLFNGANANHIEFRITQGYCWSILVCLLLICRRKKGDQLIDILKNIPRRLRLEVKEVTVDMAGSLNRVVDKCFPNASRVIDRFHVQQLAFEGVQEVRIKYRCGIIQCQN